VIAEPLNSAWERVICPGCHGRVVSVGATVSCTSVVCGAEYPIIDAVPILIDERKSVFAIADFQVGAATTFKPQNRFKKAVRRLLPSDGLNLASTRNYQSLSRLLKEVSASPRVLVIGGGVIGEGSDSLLLDPAITVINTDVSRGLNVAMICDAHDLPFDDKSFDGVVVQAVLEHVVDPVRCVSEIHRVLRPMGLVYSETPFMQQVHMGRYDFTRFTHLGHRRLFRNFEEVGSGVACGPGMALAWAFECFLISFATASWIRAGLRIVARLSSFYLKYFDYLLVDRPGAIDAASGFWFIGRKADNALSDRQLIGLYRGAL